MRQIRATYRVNCPAFGSALSFWKIELCRALALLSFVSALVWRKRRAVEVGFVTARGIPGSQKPPGLAPALSDQLIPREMVGPTRRILASAGSRRCIEGSPNRVAVSVSTVRSLPQPAGARLPT